MLGPSNAPKPSVPTTTAPRHIPTTTPVLPPQTTTEVQLSKESLRQLRNTPANALSSVILVWIAILFGLPCLFILIALIVGSASRGFTPNQGGGVKLGSDVEYAKSFSYNKDTGRYQPCLAHSPDGKTCISFGVSKGWGYLDR